jgi:nucleotide-binding universal stress UspA family protein
MPRDILVPLDGSTFSEHALPVAADLARRTGARLHLVQIHEPIAAQMPVEGVVAWDARWDGAIRANEEEYLRSIAGICAERTGIQPVTELLEGAVIPALAAYAAEMNIGRIIMTTHGRGGISRVWMGSVADALVRRAATPVLLVRPREEPVAWDRGLSATHVLVPLDGSELAEGIIDAAMELGNLSGARYTLLRVVLPLPFIVPPGNMGMAYSESGAVETRDAATTYLASAAARLRERAATVQTAAVFHTSPALGILDYAAANSVDMIAMATHGRGGWSRVALGSVADKVMRGTMMPVLLYRPTTPRGGNQRTAEVAGAAGTVPA